MKTILLTGATGFLGSHLLEGLLKSNYQVVILKRSTSDIWRIKKLLNKKIKVYDTDIVTLEKAFLENDIYTIVHLATLYQKFDNNVDIKEMFDSNITFPTQILELGIKYGTKCFINTGTFFEYDCLSLPVNEKANIKPFNLYSKTKLAFESILESYSNNIIIRTLRIFSPYGERDNDKLIPMIIKKALRNEKIDLSDGLQKLDFIYASDIVDAYLSTINRLNSPFSYRVYNIGSGTATSVREVVSIVEQQLEKNIDKSWGKQSKVDMSVVIADVTRAKNELDWIPKTSIQKGISKTLQYYKDFDL